MKLDVEVRHKSEDIEDEVLLDTAKTIRRRVRVISRSYDIPYIAGTAWMDTLSSSTVTCRVVSGG
jgi:hypothetical protein